MKKQLLVLGFLCAATQQLYGLTDKQVLQGIVSNHTRALDRRNMYERPLDSGDLHGWNQAIIDVKEFVERNSKKNKKQLMRYFNEIQNANNDLINGIKSAYAQVIGGGVDEDVRKQFGKKFTTIDTHMKRIQKNLDWVATKSEVENQAIKLLGTLARFVGVTARKAGNNLNIMVMGG